MKTSRQLLHHAGVRNDLPRMRKKSGWLLAIQVLFTLSKCPLCWLLYLALFEAAVFSKAGAIAAIVAAGTTAVFLLRWMKRRRALSLPNYFAGSTSA